MTDVLIPAPPGWRALCIDYMNGGTFTAPIVAWREGDIRGVLYLEPVCATHDPPAYPRVPTEDELVAVYEPGAELTEGDYEAAAEHEKAVREGQEREERRAAS